MSLNLVSVTKGVHPCEKYDKIKTIAADDLTALSLVRLKDPPEGMTAAQNCFAMKYVNTSGSGEDIDIAIDEIRNEIDKYLSLRPHPNIVRVYDIFETSTNIFIVMEFCTGGNIIGRSIREGNSYLFKPKSEHEASQIIVKLLSAVRFLHDHHIIHGEIRPENICYETADDDAQIKIVDLGMSRRDTSKARGEYMNYVKNYAAAPETYKGQYLAASDMWSVGVIAFILLSGKFPFARNKTGSAGQHVKEGEFDFLAGTWEFISDEAMGFIRKLLVVNPAARLTAAEAQKDLWFQKEFKLTERAPNNELVLGQIRTELQLAAEMTQFHKIVLETVAHRLSRRDLLELRKAFDVIDENNSGMISFRDFQTVMHQANLPDEDLTAIFDGVCIEENSSNMSYIEFLAATLQFHTTVTEAALVEAFHRLDTDGNGYVTTEDIMDVYPTSKEDAEHMLKEVAGGEDGKISCEVFLAAFRTESEKLRTEAMDPILIGN